MIGMVGTDEARDVKFKWVDDSMKIDEGRLVEVQWGGGSSVGELRQGWESVGCTSVVCGSVG